MREEDEVGWEVYHVDRNHLGRVGRRFSRMGAHSHCFSFISGVLDDFQVHKAAARLPLTGDYGPCGRLGTIDEQREHLLGRVHVATPYCGILISIIEGVLRFRTTLTY